MTPGDRRTAGFSLIELLTAMVVIGILAAIALPAFRDSIARADARKVVTDVAAVRTAVFEYREDEGRLPRRAAWGTMPPELAPYLDHVDFTYKGLQYRVTSNRRRGRVDFLVRYDRRDPVASALQTFARPGSDSGSATWARRRMRFRLLEDHQ